MFLRCTLRAVCIFAVGVTLAMTSQASRDYERREMLLDALRVVRRSHCAVLTDQCFSTSHCCSGLVCAAFDDYSGQKPEIPGTCVVEKDLKSCLTGLDCAGGDRCIAVGRSSELYCIPMSARFSAGKHGRLQAVQGGGLTLGAVCETSGDCRQTTLDGQDGLCCKEVRRGRQRAQRICERMGTHESCI